MNILYLQYSNPWNPFSPGGIGIVNHGVFVRLSQNHQVTVLTGRIIRGDPHSVIDGVTYYNYASSNYRVLDRILFSVSAALINYYSYDIIIIPWDRYAPVRFSHMHRPVVVELHANYFDMPSKIGLAEPVTRWLLKKALDKVEYLGAVSLYLLNRVHNAGHNFRQSSVLPNGIDSELFCRETTQKSGSHLLFLGRLDIKTKGIDTLLSAYHHSNIDVPLVIAGDGEDRDTLARMIKDQQMETRVRLVGWVDGVQKRQLIEQSIAVCMPSRSEGFGITALEAMSLGKPVVGSTVEGLQEIVENNVSGLLVDAENVDAYSSALFRIVSEPDLLSRLEEGAIKRASAFTLEASASARLHFFESVLEDFSEIALKK